MAAISSRSLDHRLGGDVGALVGGGDRRGPVRLDERDARVEIGIFLEQLGGCGDRLRGGGHWRPPAITLGGVFARGCGAGARQVALDFLEPAPADRQMTSSAPAVSRISLRRERRSTTSTTRPACRQPRMRRGERPCRRSPCRRGRGSRASVERIDQQLLRPPVVHPVPRGDDREADRLADQHVEHRAGMRQPVAPFGIGIFAPHLAEPLEEAAVADPRHVDPCLEARGPDRDVAADPFGHQRDLHRRGELLAVDRAGLVEPDQRALVAPRGLLVRLGRAFVLVLPALDELGAALRRLARPPRCQDAGGPMPPGLPRPPLELSCSPRAPAPRASLISPSSPPSATGVFIGQKIEVRQSLFH
jgi:hypothetical protein